MLRHICLHLAIVAACVASGCVSPVDTDTPRYRFTDVTVPPPDRPARIKASSFTVTARDMGTQTDWKVVLKDPLAEIDTSVHPPAVWISATVGREFNTESPVTPFIQEYRLRVDSLVADNSLLNITGPPASPYGAAFSVAVERDTLGVMRTVSLTANGEKNLASIRIESGGGKGYLVGVLNINLLAHRLQVESKLTIRY